MVQAGWSLFQSSAAFMRALLRMLFYWNTFYTSLERGQNMLRGKSPPQLLPIKDPHLYNSYVLDWCKYTFQGDIRSRPNGKCQSASYQYILFEETIYMKPFGIVSIYITEGREYSCEATSKTLWHIIVSICSSPNCLTKVTLFGNKASIHEA